MNTKQIVSFISLALLAAIGTAQTAPKPFGPGLEVEKSAPFSYFLVPSDELGFKDCPQGIQITADGAINNGFGELDFFTGNKLKPIRQRIKTLYQDHFPIVLYGFNQDGAHFGIQAFGAPFDLDPKEDLVGFIKIFVTNPTQSTIQTDFRAEYQPRKTDSSRSELPMREWYQAKFMDSNSFKTGTSELGNGTAIKHGHLVYMYSGTPQLDPTELAVIYHLTLAPGESKQIELRLPVVPIDLSRKGFIAKAEGMHESEYFGKVVDFWNGIFNRATEIDLPDPKVVNTMKSSLAYDLIARDIDADGVHFTQTVNKFQYHYFYPRDTSFIARSYEMMNLPDVAKTTVDHYLIRDTSGKVISFRHEMPDDWGQSIWALASYLRTSGDADFAKDFEPAIAQHLDIFEKSIASDPLGLWPVAGPYDNELIDGHYTSHNLWALLGLEDAEYICRLCGDTTQADRAHSLYQKFHETFINRLATLTAKDEGYIPPGMDDPNKGYDWENASGGVYPFHVLPKNDPWAIATVNMERNYKYREGIMTWGPNAWLGKQAADAKKPFDPLYLHDYDTYQVDETLLAMGQQQAVVEDLYSSLVHTSSTNAGFETGILPWGNRDPDGNDPPHGWFAARYNELVRNMLVREEGDELHIASALAPDWVQPGKTVVVKRAATSFGEVNYTIRSTKDGAEITFNNHWRTAPKKIIIHIPWFLTVTSVNGDLEQNAGYSPTFTFDSDVKKVTFKWNWTSHPDLSYNRAVEIWLRKNYGGASVLDKDHLFPFTKK